MRYHKKHMYFAPKEGLFSLPFREIALGMPTSIDKKFVGLHKNLQFVGQSGGEANVHSRTLRVTDAAREAFSVPAECPERRGLGNVRRPRNETNQRWSFPTNSARSYLGQVVIAERESFGTFLNVGRSPDLETWFPVRSHRSCHTESDL
jgi:hypothetical protein